MTLKLSLIWKFQNCVILFLILWKIYPHTWNTEEPMGLVFHEDNYYLICYHTYYGHPYALRVDRMCDVDLADEDISPKVQKLVHETDFAAFTEQAFKMYYAETKAVSIRFTNDLIGTVFDKFGEDTPMKRIDEAVVEALLKVQVSPIMKRDTVIDTLDVGIHDPGIVADAGFRP